jgi:hypothetical protein
MNDAPAHDTKPGAIALPTTAAEAVSMQLKVERLVARLLDKRVELTQRIDDALRLRDALGTAYRTLLDREIEAQRQARNAV